jgi:hypothetical protein
MKYRKQFRQVYEPFLKDYGYSWYKKFFVRLDSKKEVLSIVSYRTVPYTGYRSSLLDVAVLHILVGSFSIEELLNWEICCLSEPIDSHTSHKKNTEPRRFCGYLDSEEETIKGFEGTLSLLKMYCSEIFDVYEVPDHLDVIPRISHRLIQEGALAHPLVDPNPVIVNKYDCAVWMRDFKLAKTISEETYRRNRENVLSNIESAKKKMNEFSYIKSTDLKELTHEDKNQLNYMKYLKRRPKDLEESVELTQSVLEHQIKRLKILEDEYHELQQIIESDPESLRNKLEETRQLNIQKLEKKNVIKLSET